MVKKSVTKVTKKGRDTGDNSFLILIGAFLLCGLIVIYSSTVVHSQALFNSPFRFVLLQLGWIIASLIGFFYFYNVSSSQLARIAPIIMAVSITSLGLLAISGVLPCSWSMPFAPCINEANRWVVLNPAPFPQIPFLGELGFQPSELAKLALIIYLSVKLSNLKPGKSPFLTYLFITGLTAGLILLEPNMSTALVVLTIGTVMYFCSGYSLKPLLILMPIVFIASVFFTVSSPYRRERLSTFLSQATMQTEGAEDLASGYHIKQVSIALGLGGFWGVGFGRSKQKYYLPEVSSDSIFAIIGEEFGFFGAAILVAAFAFFAYKGFSLVPKLEDSQSRLVAVGITTWICFQFIVHVAANTGVIPYTGVPIPLISYGGSSMVFSMMGLGLLAGLSKNR